MGLACYAMGHQSSFMEGAMCKCFIFLLVVAVVIVAAVGPLGILDKGQDAPVKADTSPTGQRVGTSHRVDPTTGELRLTFQADN
ncbi:hypothetical protein A2368_04135 [Candidatus Collierbacteria bacterium RIFOXYB1_FULL_49_13]|uniref:Uncharacterized protein n=1 Tax=Candidatus Collierbacteria bacterium RIFOXYB1_FULL_49_13 TaxID=1817728 RepID=A0A1F5FHB5_9BACT|nr:MAG: hypothetical protein A2368_04135 [Candidatus Collierbacteria bacterium RIFOXYB1_FULL_49_13]